MTAEVITKRDEDALEFLSDVRLELLEDATVRRLLRHSPLPPLWRAQPQNTARTKSRHRHHLRLNANIMSPRLSAELHADLPVSFQPLL